jgi:deoxyribose-phosphate aldolase
VVVIGFPHGCGLSEVKALEAKAYVEKGLHEIDMVVNWALAIHQLLQFVVESPPKQQVLTSIEKIKT